MQARRKSKGSIFPGQVLTNEITNTFILDLDDGLSGEQRAHVECVLRIIKNFIEKSQVALILPYILSSDILNEYNLADIHIDILLKNIQNVIKFKRTTIEECIPSLHTFIEENFETTKLWSNYLFFLSPENTKFLKVFHLLYNTTKKRLSQSALSDISKEKKLLKLQNNIVSLNKSIVETKEKLRKAKVFQNWKHALRLVLIHKFEETLAFQNFHNMRVKQEIARSGKNIRHLQIESTLRLDQMDEEVKKLKVAYNRVLRENLSTEKDARDEKKKLLFQLQTYIRKYDQNVGDKIKENLSLQEEYIMKKEKYDNFMIEYLLQEEEFKAIQQQKEKEEQFIFEQKLYMFMMGRAARVIQVRWRGFRREQKKKSKKGKGKGRKK